MTVQSIERHIYNQDYYLTNCDGFEVFSNTQGAELPDRLSYAWQISNIQSGMTLLDVGFGRGEIFYRGHQAQTAVFGVDYSDAAVKIGQILIQQHQLSGTLIQADATAIPFTDNYFDRVLMLDVVEHLYPWELQQSYQEIWRVLKSGGQLIIHTAPNLWYYQYGYPIYRLLNCLRGHKLPVNPRDRFKFHQTHVNEQSILSLKRQLSQAGFEVTSWLTHIPKDTTPLPWLARLITPVLYNVPPLLWIFRNDLFAIARKI